MASIPPSGRSGKNQMASALSSGLNTIDQDQEVGFVLYNRFVNPLDGSVFWVNSSLTNGSGKPTTFNARGSLHHTTTNTQDPDESASVHRMVFTSLQPVDILSATSPTKLWMAKTDSESYAFSTRSGFYRQSGLHHYSGDAVYPSMSTQVIDTQAQLDDASDLIVSNSLPIWLTLNTLFPIYPSLLVPDNLKPPYASVHIGDGDTTPLTNGPTYDSSGTRWQLVKDRVRIATYGIRNDLILDFLDAVRDYTLANPTVMGVMNIPIPRDGKRGQVETSTIAQRKTIDFEVNYYQNRVRDINRKLITEALFHQFIAHS